MLIECPACATQYELADEQIPAKGRKVRCARCAHVWFLAKPVTAPPQEDADTDKPGNAADLAAADAAMTAALGEDADGTGDAETDTGTDSDTADAPDVAPALPTEEPEAEPDELEDPWERRRRRSAAMSDLPENLSRRPDLPSVEEASLNPGMKMAAAWLGFAVIVAGTAYGGHAYRDQVVETIPQTQPIYEMLGYSFSGPLDGLNLADIRSDRSLENGSSVLVVEGKVTNSSDQNKRLPTLRAQLLDDRQNLITEWQFSIDLGVVAAGGEAPFREVVIDPDPTAVDIQISFVTDEN